MEQHFAEDTFLPSRSTTSDIGAGVVFHDHDFNNGGGLIWKNPAPDASAPMAPAPGSVHQLSLGGPDSWVPGGEGILIGKEMITAASGVGVGKSMFDTNPAPNASVPMQANGITGTGTATRGVPTAIKRTFAELIDSVREEFRKLEGDLSVQRQELIKARVTIAELSVDVEKYKYLYNSATEKLERIKNHLAE